MRGPKKKKYRMAQVSAIRTFLRLEDIGDEERPEDNNGELLIAVGRTVVQTRLSALNNIKLSL